MSLSPGTKIAHYEIRERIGKGGMGEVYRATDTKLGREVALKTLPPEVTGDAERLARFEREAKLLASLNHPHIAAIYGLEEAEGKPFLVLELVAGEDLQERLRRGVIPVDEALDSPMALTTTSGLAPRPRRPTMSSVVSTAGDTSSTIRMGKQLISAPTPMTSPNGA